MPSPSPTGWSEGRRYVFAAPLALCAAAAMAATDAGQTPGALAAPMKVEFNTDFLSPQTRAGIDVARFEQGNPVLPGEYRVELYLNGRPLGRTHLTVKPGDAPERGRVCMTRALLDLVGLDWSQLDPAARQILEDPAACAVLEELSPEGRAEFDSGQLRLDVSLPQMALRRAPRGYVNPELWDSGVTGGLLNYTLNSYRNERDGAATHSTYLGLNAGFNAGDWHFRHNGARNWQSGEGYTRGSYQSINTYVERELPDIMGRLTLGEANTGGHLFNAQSFRGVQLASDDRMLPDSQRGYAPVVRGMAETNARVTIRQRGILLYDTPVPPGPFVIDDLYPAGYGGDLEVTVTEGDGRVRTFTVPYAAVAQLLRPGQQRYSLTAGTLRNVWLSFTPKLIEATYQRGLSNSLTGYGGVQGGDHYAAAIGGVALGTSFGAFSFDLTGSRTELPSGPDRRMSGTSARTSYSKRFQETGSSLSLAAYRFSTHGYLDMPEAMRAIDAVDRGLSRDVIQRPRSRLSLTLSQPLGEGWGHLYLNGFRQNYWTEHPKDTQFQFGYSNQFRSLMYSLSVARTRDLGGGMDNRVMLNLSLPLGQSWQAPRMSAIVSHDPNGTSAQTMISGVAGEHSQWSYNAAVANEPGEAGTSGTVNGQYVGARTTVTAGYGKGRGYNNVSAGLSGSIVAHPDGLTLSPYASETVAVVAAAPEAAGARVLGYPGVTLDDSGHAVLPYLRPYRVNEVAIDPNGIAPEVELKTASQQVTPRAGAIVLLRYDTALGRAALIDAALPDGAALPFGAEVQDEQGNVVGSVGQAGRIYARLSGDEARLTVRWGRDQHCSMHAALPPAESASGIPHLQLPCAPGGASATHYAKTGGAE